MIFDPPSPPNVRFLHFNVRFFGVISDQNKIVFLHRNSFLDEPNPQDEQLQIPSTSNSAGKKGNEKEGSLENQEKNENGKRPLESELEESVPERPLESEPEIQRNYIMKNYFLYFL